MYNFLDPKLMPKLQCSAPAMDNYEPHNLISDNEAVRARGFLAYTVTRPPIELEFEFLCSVDISFIILQTSIGNQKCTGIELFARSEASSYVSIAKAVYNTPGLTFCTSRKYSRTNLPPNHDPTNGLFFFKNDTVRVFMNAKFLKVVIFRTERTVPCLGGIKVFGKPARSCSEATVTTIDRIMGRIVPKVTTGGKENNTNFAIPQDFIDDLTCEVMAVPMTLPSGKTVDRDTLEKHIENEKSFGRKPGDPFTGLNFTENRKPVMNVALKSRIDMFLIQNSTNPSTFSLKRTLGSDQINSFKRLRTSETSVQCCVCQQDQNLYEIPCRHYYCRQCLLTLLSHKCNICNTEFSKSEATRFHV
ncbi:hypothetical protein Zmor_027421 [Zophobas morio]|uniref:RING finger protein 37 n=1 Tax=Zophobas morio TaxID=2755281 RepID=A0AA38HNZ5_9CUCU|nr:hypothetical protein Zmor_027421 [Zophobas morio]